jgi:hypothetical protein
LHNCQVFLDQTSILNVGHEWLRTLQVLFKKTFNCWKSSKIFAFARECWTKLWLDFNFSLLRYRHFMKPLHSKNYSIDCDRGWWYFKTV